MMNHLIIMSVRVVHWARLASNRPRRAEVHTGRLFVWLWDVVITFLYLLYYDWCLCTSHCRSRGISVRMALGFFYFTVFN